MKITIIGWYGTETIGDRAILAGLMSLFNKSYENFDIQLGSLYPFFSERTINEDHSFYKEITKKDIKINIFNSKDSKELNRAIKNSNLIVMGGGPLMDLSELFMIEYAFKKAKKIGVKTALLGCGIGPLFYKKYRKAVLGISLNSDLTILRDNKSKESLRNIYKEFNKFFDSELIYTSYDPAVECALEFNKLHNKINSDYIAINLRKFPLEYSKDNDSKNIDDNLKNLIVEVEKKFKNKEIRLVPMHYFHIGGDDRMFLNKISLELGSNNIKVQNSNLTLRETLSLYQNAYFNIGMRFHAIVLQTISSGKNYILDYTEPKKGKISSFLSDIDKNDFFKSRYLSLQEDEISAVILREERVAFNYNKEIILKRLSIYIKKLIEIDNENINHKYNR